MARRKLHICPECGFGFVPTKNQAESGKVSWENCSGAPNMDGPPAHRPVAFKRVSIRVPSDVELRRLP